MNSKKALIIGTSRGLGLALVKEFLRRQWSVVGTVRQEKDLNLHGLRSTVGDRLSVERLDVTSDDQLVALKGKLCEQKFDLLFVNAGVSNGRHPTIAEVSTEEFTRVMVTNTLSPMRVIESLRELVTDQGTIGVMSSGQGSVGNNQKGGFEVYRASKAALNTLMRSYAARHAADKHALLLIAPGWIRTDMGGEDATYTVEEAIPRVVDTLLAQSGKPGLQYLDQFGQVVPW